jgi:phytoene dehydrogenase-like protein
MPQTFDAIVVGAGLGGLTAAALLARQGRKVMVIERSHSIGGAASTYKSGDLVVEASLHETSAPAHPTDPKHHILAKLGLLDTLTWVPTGGLYEVRGGPIGAPLVVPDGFTDARAALAERFPAARGGLGTLLREMENIAEGLGHLSKGRAAFERPLDGLAALRKLGPVVSGWRLSVGERLQRALGDHEAAKWAIGANLPYYHDDPDALWWVLFAVAQGGFISAGARYIRGGSSRLSHGLARLVRDSGGSIATQRTASAILLDPQGRVRGVAHEGRRGAADRDDALAPVILANAAPAVIADLLPVQSRAAFAAPFGKRPLSISLFSLTFGLCEPPATFGLNRYSTILVPDWMTALRDHRASADVLAALPGERMPLLAIVSYAAIDSGLGGPPFPVSVVGVDRVGNWQGLDAAAYDAKRVLWREAIAGTIDRAYPGFKAAITTSVFSTARTMQTYLNQPAGAIYGFAPLPPARAIWHGPERSPRTAIPNLFLASSYAGSGGFTGAIMAGAAAAELALAASNKA